MIRKNRIPRINRLLVLVVILIPIVMSSCSGKPQTTSSGIKGIVMIGPISPVVKEGEPDEKAYPDALIYVLDASGKKLAEVTSDEEGRFTIGLQPGKYSVAPQTPKDQILPIGESQEVLVTENTYSEITVHYDSGIR